MKEKDFQRLLAALEKIGDGLEKFSNEAVHAMIWKAQQEHDQRRERATYQQELERRRKRIVDGLLVRLSEMLKPVGPGERSICQTIAEKLVKDVEGHFYMGTPAFDEEAATKIAQEDFEARVWMHWSLGKALTPQFEVMLKRIGKH